MNGFDGVDMLFAAALVLAMGVAGMHGDERHDGRDGGTDSATRATRARHRRVAKAFRTVLVLIAVAFAMAWVGMPDVTAPAVAGPSH